MSTGETTHDELRQKLLEIIEAESGIPSAEIDADADFREEAYLDSMQFIAIAARIEDEFNIELPITVINVTTLNEFLDFLIDTMSKS
jgi:acyl carrier protein